MNRTFKMAIIVVAVGIIAPAWPVKVWEGVVTVEVTWSVLETSPRNHVIAIAGDSFTIPAGKSVKRTQRYCGGGEDGLVLDTRGWGFQRQTLMVDGTEVSIGRIRHCNRNGTWGMFGFVRSPSMNAEIQLEKEKTDL